MYRAVQPFDGQSCYNVVMRLFAALQEQLLTDGLYCYKHILNNTVFTLNTFIDDYW